MKNLILSLFLLFSSSLFSQTALDWADKGIAKSESGNFRGAILDFNKAIELDQQNYFFYLFRGNAKKSLGDFRGAILDFNKSIELNPKNGGFYLSRGKAKYLIGLKNEGCLDFSKSGELGNADAYDLIKSYCNN